MKKIVLVFAIALSCAAVLFASGGQSKQTTSGTSSGPMTISVVSYQRAPVEKDGKMLKFFNEKFNVVWDVWNIDNSAYDEQVNLKLAANEIPDFFRTEGKNFNAYYKQGVLAEVNEDLFKTKMAKLYKEYNDAIPGILNMYKIDGKIWATPASYEKNYGQQIIYRGDWMKNVGITKVPETIAELEKLVYAFTNNDPGQTPVSNCCTTLIKFPLQQGEAVFFLQGGVT